MISGTGIVAHPSEYNRSMASKRSGVGRHERAGANRLPDSRASGLDRLERGLHHGAGVRDAISDARVTTAAGIAADAAARAHAVAVMIDRAGVLGIDGAGVLVLHERF